VERQVVEARREIDVVGVGFPLHRETEELNVELLHLGEVADVQSQVPEAGVGWTRHGDTIQLGIND
jgi:hypothetical protein